MGKRSRIMVAWLAVLVLLGTVGLTACTREKPAPTPRAEWTPSAGTPATGPVETPIPGAAVGGTAVSVDATRVSPELASTVVPDPLPTAEEAVSVPVEPDVVPTPAPPAPGTVGGMFTYVVRSGETLFSIANRYGSSVDELVRLNDLVDADGIQAGQKLKIPGESSPDVPPVTPEEIVHLVQSGETLRSIALRYDVTTQAIMTANSITDPNRILVGQRLTIPGGVVPVEPGPTYHLVQRGETLSPIAGQHGVSTLALQAANGITDPDSIYVGQRLTIP